MASAIENAAVTGVKEGKIQQSTNDVGRTVLLPEDTKGAIKACGKIVRIVKNYRIKSLSESVDIYRWHIR